MSRYVVVTPSEGSVPEAATTVEATVRQARGTILARLSSGVFARLEDGAARKLEGLGCSLLDFPDPSLLTVAGHAVARTEWDALQGSLAKARTDGWRQFVVQFAAPPENDWIHGLEERGLRVTGRLGTYGAVVEGEPEAAEAAAAAKGVALITPYQPAWRISPNLRGLAGRIQFVAVTVSPADEADRLAKDIDAAGGRIERIWAEDESPGLDTRVVIAEIDAAQLDALAQRPEVRWLDFQSPTYAPEDERSAQIVAGNLNGGAAPNTLPVPGYGAFLAGLTVDGTGVIVAINDTGVDTNSATGLHGDFAGRFAFGPAAPGSGDTDGHGTHVAGIALGNGGTGDLDAGGFVIGQGVAPGARLGVITNMNTVSMASFSQTAVQNAAEVMNCSWRVNPAGNAYSNGDALIDASIRDGHGVTAGMQPLVVCFSAGNSGPGATTTTKQTKNALVVGNTRNARPGELNANDDIRALRTDSSRGPAVDGRLMPMICAPGTDIVSARPNTDTNPVAAGVQRPGPEYTDAGGNAHANHTVMSGTSMASPHVAGLCALLIEWWRDRTGGRTPSPAMLKALLVNGAVDCAGGSDGNGGVIGNIPNHQQGWGRAHLRNVVERGPKILMDQRHAFTANGQTYRLRVAVTDPATPLRVTLAWTDAPGNPASAQVLVNDLDLEVRSVATGTLFRGAGGPGAGFTGGFSVANQPRDTLNNLECVYINGPAGEYDITVRATSVTANARPPYDTNAWQDFALVIDNAERAGSAPAGIVTILDRSGSMVSAGYVDRTRTSARAFIDRLRIGDYAGVVSFGSGARREYPPAGGTATPIGTAADRDAARQSVDGIVFGGTTHMGPGISMGASLLTAVPAGVARGMALFSDGYDNGTPSAAAAVAGLPAGLPVYTCAMGPLSDQALLEQIATDTGGRYYFMPTIDELFEIHNYISGSLTGDSLVANESAQASSSRVEAYVDGTVRAATFCVAWGEVGLKYVGRAPKGPEEITVRLRAPNGKLLPANTAYVQRTEGQGYVQFRVEEPAAGRWYMEVATDREAHTRYTAACFVDSPLRLRVRPDRLQVKPDRLWQVVAGAVLDGKLVDGIRIKSRITRPTFDATKLLTQFKGLKVDVVKGDRVPARLADLARLGAIRTSLVREGHGDPLAYSAAPLAWRLQSPEAAARFVPRTAGSHNVRLTVFGTVPGSGAPFVRQELVSFLAG